MLLTETSDEYFFLKIQMTKRQVSELQGHEKSVLCCLEFLFSEALMWYIFGSPSHHYFILRTSLLPHPNLLLLQKVEFPTQLLIKLKQDAFSLKAWVTVKLLTGIQLTGSILTSDKFGNSRFISWSGRPTLTSPLLYLFFSHKMMF